MKEVLVLVAHQSGTCSLHIYLETSVHINCLHLKSNLLIFSVDYELDTSLDGDLLSLAEIQEAPSGPEWLLQELVSLRLALSQEDIESSAQADWLALCSKLDRLLFRVYLLVLTVYTATLLLLWATWSFAWTNTRSETHWSFKYWTGSLDLWCLAYLQKF